MYVYYCNKCQSFESFSGLDEEWMCKNCGNTLISLGVTIDEWNDFSEEDMMKTLQYAEYEAAERDKKNDYSDQMTEEETKVEPVIRVNLMDCPKCFRQISPNAVNCPYCNYYFANNPAARRKRQKNRRMSVIFGAIAAALVILYIVYSLIFTTLNIPEQLEDLFAGFYSGGETALCLCGYAFLIAGIVMAVLAIINLIKSFPKKNKEDSEADDGFEPFEEGVSEISGDDGSDDGKDITVPASVAGGDASKPAKDHSNASALFVQESGYSKIMKDLQKKEERSAGYRVMQQEAVREAGEPQAEEAVTETADEKVQPAEYHEAVSVQQPENPAEPSENPAQQPVNFAISPDSPVEKQASPLQQDKMKAQPAVSEYQAAESAQPVNNSEQPSLKTQEAGAAVQSSYPGHEAAGIQPVAAEGAERGETLAPGRFETVLDATISFADVARNIEKKLAMDADKEKNSEAGSDNATDADAILKAATAPLPDLKSAVQLNDKDAIEILSRD